MKTLQDILDEVKAIDTTELSGVEAALTAVEGDLQALVDAQASAGDPIVSITTTTQSGVTAEFVPKA